MTVEIDRETESVAEMMIKAGHKPEYLIIKAAKDILGAGVHTPERIREGERSGI